MITDLIGKTLTEVTGMKGGAEIVFTASDGTKYIMHHNQDCCEAVWIEDIVGDLEDLVGAPITKASVDVSDEEIRTTNRASLMRSDESQTWTFYNLATIKGYVTIRWYGTSNGYYSESVDFEQI